MIKTGITGIQCLTFIMVTAPAPKQLYAFADIPGMLKTTYFT